MSEPGTPEPPLAEHHDPEHHPHAEPVGEHPPASHPEAHDAAPFPAGEPPLLDPIAPPLGSSGEAAGKRPVEAPHSEPAGTSTAAPEPVKPARPRRDPLPVLFGLGIIVLIGAVVYLFYHPINAASSNDDKVAALQQQLASLQQRLDALEQRPAAPPASPGTVDLAPLEQRVSALEQRPAPGAADQPPPIDKAARDQATALAARLEALAKQQAQLAAAQSEDASRLAAEQQRLAALAGQAGQVTALAGRLDAADQRLGALASQAGQISAVAGRLDQQEKQVGALTSQAGQITGLAERAALVARIQAATAALAEGRPLGDLPNAPGALARFRSDPPPTEASLRLSFAAAAAAAAEAARPDTAHLPFWEAVQTRAEELVTVRRGDQVIIGDPAAGVIARARHALEAGDLAGTVAVLGELTGKPAAAFADWLHRAQSLLEARAALAALAAHA